MANPPSNHGIETGPPDTFVRLLLSKCAQQSHFSLDSIFCYDMFGRDYITMLMSQVGPPSFMLHFHDMSNSDPFMVWRAGHSVQIYPIALCSHTAGPPNKGQSSPLELLSKEDRVTLLSF